MEPEDMPFEEFFARRMKDKGMTLRRLSDITGIAPTHIENMLRGDFDNMPSPPYFHGYLIRLGKVLDFDGEEQWMILKSEGVIRKPTESDSLPKNRFIKKAPPKFLWGIGIGIIVIIFLVLQAPRILGKPTLIVTFPSTNPYTTQSNILTLTGSIKNAESLYLNGDEVTIGTDGAWQKGVLLQNGVNTFQLSAKKFLGGETDVMEQILYAPSATSTQNASTTASSTGNL